MLLPCPQQWSEQTFGACELGDQRRTARLVKVGAGLARHIGQSMVKSCANDAEIEGAYRLIRNDQVSSEAIAEGGFQSTVQQTARSTTLLALEDSTSLTYRHAVRSGLGPVGSDKHSQGLMVHSVLLVDADTEHTVGLIEQQRWCRSAEAFGIKHQRKQRAYLDKESFKWESASEAMAQRLGALMPRVISVCDRESDIYDYLQYKQAHRQRFVVRACQDRRLADVGTLFEFARGLEGIEHYPLTLPQKGGRPVRQATMALSWASVTLCPPATKQPGAPAVTVTLVCCQEITAGQADPLCWRLLTTEPVTSAAQARDIVRYYEWRWKIEDYHKAWKSGGTQVQKQRMHSADNLERMAVILSFVAVRLLQLRESALDSGPAQPNACTQLLNAMQWQLLWRKTQKGPLPKAPPDIHWAYYALAKLGGWHDSKRTGKVGWTALWEGWFKLEQMVEGARLLNELQEE